MLWNRSKPIEVMRDEDHRLMNSESSATVLKPLPSEMDNEVKTTVLPQTAGVAINNRFFFVALAAGALVMIGVHFLHAYQMERISRVFFENAEQSARAGESRDAVRFVQKYLNFHPNDLEARVLLASELAKTAETPRQMLNVALICEGVLRRDATRRDLRLQIAKFYLRLGQHRDALVHLIVLLGETPDNGELLLQAAECHQALGEYDKAAATYRQLIRLNPQDARVYERLAYLLRDEMRQPEAADHLIQELMDSNQRNALAYGVRARYRHRYGELKHAARDAGIAYQLDPQNSDVVQVVATITIDQLKAGEKTDFPPTQVRSDLKRLLAKTPEDKAIVAALIDLDLADGRSERAEERLRSLLKDNPTNVAARFQLADLLLVANRVNESKSEIGRIRNLGVRSQAVDFLEARILIVQKRWLDAIHILENVHFSSAEAPELASSVYQQLGQCYEQIGHHHRRLRAYRDAVTADPRSADAHLGLASALARMGRIDDALAEYQQLREHPAVALATAQLQLLKQLLLPKAERNWTGVESAIAEAIRKNADADQTLRLRVLVMMAQEQEDAARRFLEQERNKRPKSLAVWLLSAQIENWAGQPDRAAKVLENAQGVLGKSVDLQLARLRLRSRRGEGTNADWVLGQMEAWDDLPENFRVPVLGELTEGLEETKSDPQEALRLRLEMAALKPNDLRIWRRVLSLGIAANDDEAATRAVGEIRRIEGESGSYWRLAEADRLLMHARQGKTEFDGAAEKLLEKLRNDLPTDWTIPLRLAEIAERQGRTDCAIDHYKAILNMEMYHPQVVKRLIALLFSKGRDAEADGYLTKLQRTRPNSFGAQYGRVATVVALRSQHRIRALELARQAVKTDSKDPKDQLWLGQILGVLEMPQQAETALRKSIELEPQQTAARIALVRLLQTSNRVQEAREEIQALKDAVPAEKAAFPLAYCLELTDQPQAAYQAYQDLVKNNAREGYFRWVLADYCLRSGRRPQAESLLRSLLDSPHKWKDAPQLAVRRSLAQVLVQKPGYRSNVEALALLEKNLGTDSRSLPDLRMKRICLPGGRFVNSARKLWPCSISWPN